GHGRDPVAVPGAAGQHAPCSGHRARGPAVTEQAGPRHHQDPDRGGQRRWPHGDASHRDQLHARPPGAGRLTVPADEEPAGEEPAGETRRLVLLRHAKSDWPDVPDRERPLAKRGRREAPAAGRCPREHGYQPDVVVCWVARRTRQTWELIEPELGGSPAVTFDQRAYDAGARTLLYLARELLEAGRTVGVIGHNP